MTKSNDKKNDEAVDMTFPASDPTAHRRFAVNRLSRWFSASGGG